MNDGAGGRVTVDGLEAYKDNSQHKVCQLERKRVFQAVLGQRTRQGRAKLQD